MYIITITTNGYLTIVFVYLMGVWCMYCNMDYREFDCGLEHISTNIDISFRTYLKLITIKLMGEIDESCLFR